MIGEVNPSDVQWTGIAPVGGGGGGGGGGFGVGDGGGGALRTPMMALDLIVFALVLAPRSRNLLLTSVSSRLCTMLFRASSSSTKP